MEIIALIILILLGGIVFFGLIVIFTIALSIPFKFWKKEYSNYDLPKKQDSQKEKISNIFWLFLGWLIWVGFPISLMLLGVVQALPYLEALYGWAIDLFLSEEKI